jgi:hypothetical protein
MNMSISLSCFHLYACNVHLNIAPVINPANVTIISFLGFVYVLGYKAYILFLCNSFPMLTKAEK